MPTFAQSQINPADLDPILRGYNHGFMVKWINADLFGRADCDVRTSMVFYDADRSFIYAAPMTVEAMDEELWSALTSASSIRYWSIGVGA